MEQNKIRPLWRYYFQGSNALIWVVDAADSERFHEVKEELHNVLKEQELSDSKILIFANKADLAKSDDIKNLNKTLEFGFCCKWKEIFGSTLLCDNW